MKATASFTEMPERIQLMPLPTGEADLWLRKDITKLPDSEDGTAGGYEATEAYMRTKSPVTVAEITADFEGWYDKASKWQPPVPEKDPTAEERIEALETENGTLKEQLADTMAAVDFLLFGADSTEEV